MEDSAIKGLLITISDDTGPRSVINLSKLDDTLAFKMALLGMTILMLGNSNPQFFAKRHNKLLGPLPVPVDTDIESHSEDLESINVTDSLAVIFNVKADLPTEDPRAIKHGRDAVIWYVFNSTDREKLFLITKKIEMITNSYVSKIKLESQLADEKYFTGFLEDLNQRMSEFNNNASFEKYIPEKIRYADYTLYKYDTNKERIIPIQNIVEIDKLAIFVFIDIFEKQINIIQQQKMSRKELFLVSKSVSNLNLSLKRQFIVRNVTDQIEAMMYLNRIEHVQNVAEI